jgi:mono/diheme cytochrome c family protein
MKSSIRTLMITAAALLVSAQVQALPWDKDMRNQPSVKPQESEVPSVPDSVPVTGKEAVAPPADMGELVFARLAAGELVNPIQSSPESLARGETMYEIHCLLCHGDQGRGDGLVGLKFLVAPMDLTMDYVQLQPDGQIYYTISHGSIAMPFYRDSMDEADRWHVVNYVKEVLGN